MSPAVNGPTGGSDKPEPWWNDKDKVGGIMATITVLAVSGFLVALLVIAVIRIGRAVL